MKSHKTLAHFVPRFIIFLQLQEIFILHLDNYFVVLQLFQVEVFVKTTYFLSLVHYSLSHRCHLVSIP